jgi:hypothetical protein
MLVPYLPPAEAAKVEAINLIGAACQSNFMAVDQRLRALEQRSEPGSFTMNADGTMTMKGPTAQPAHDIASLIDKVKTLTDQVAQLKRELADRPSSGVSPW